MARISGIPRPGGAIIGLRRHRRGRAGDSVGAEARTHSLRTQDARPTGFHL